MIRNLRHNFSGIANAFWLVLVLACLLCLMASCNVSKSYTYTSVSDSKQIPAIDELQQELETYAMGKDARIGIAVILNRRDTVSVNGYHDFPMMSVFKFPVALALTRHLLEAHKTLNDTVTVRTNQLLEDTWSPMLMKYGKRDLNLSYRELLEWALVESDNNATDILIEDMGGIERLNTLLVVIEGYPDGIEIGASETDMHRDPDLSFLNRTTPVAMAKLFDWFDRFKPLSSLSYYSDVASILEQCKTGTDRLAAPLMSTNAVIGHKTGTGFPTPEGRISAVNDCGYIHYPNGRTASIAVFIADSGYSMPETSKIIADISEIVNRFIGQSYKQLQ